MIAIRTKVLAVLGAVLTTFLGLVVWAAPAYAQEFSVTFECTSSGADVTFVNEEATVGLRVAYGSFDEGQPDGEFDFAAGESETISTTRSQLDYEVEQLQGDPELHSDTLDLSECGDPGDPGSDDDDDDADGDDVDDDDDDDDDDDAPRVAPDAGV